MTADRDRLPPKVIDQRVRQTRDFVAEQARRRGESEAVARQQGNYAAERAHQTLRERSK